VTSGTLTVTSADFGPTHQVSLAWTANSGGAVSQTFTLRPGAIVLIQSLPGASPLTPPAGGYQATVTDPNGVALSDDQGGLLPIVSSGSVVNPIVGVPSWPKSQGGVSYGNVPEWQPGGLCTLTVTGAGNGGQGTLNIYLLTANF
jgi:hypothetical protein